LVLLALLALGTAAIGGSRFTVLVSAASAPTPGPNAQTVYQVDNPSGAPLVVSHLFTNAQATPVFSFNSTVPASSSAQFHLRDMPQIPYGTDGQVMLSADSLFTAAVVDYDYPPTSAPTPTANASPTRTVTPMATATPTRVVIRLPFSK
jgi:hypothetical protein